MADLKALEILKSFKSAAGCREAFIGYSDRQNIYEAIKELEALENQDKLAELEKVILDCYLAQGYQIGVGDWGFKVEINSRHKHKSLNVLFGDEEGCRIVFTKTAIISSEMFDKAIEFFNLWTSKILELQNDKNISIGE